MHDVLYPATVDSEGLVEHAQDKTAPEGLVFFHAKEGKPLATPWQVASLRASMLAQHPISEGWILDCACGSGIQLAAYASTLQRPVLGIELDASRAQATAVTSTPSRATNPSRSQRGSRRAGFLRATEQMQPAPSNQ